jgi:hypothetical protein
LSRIQQLYLLQSHDSEIDRSQQQLAQINEKLGETEALQQAKTTLTAAEKALRAIQITLQDATLEVKSLADKIASQEKALYQGKALSPKEAGNLQSEINSLKRRHSQREEQLLEAMLAAEEAELHQQQVQQAWATVQAAWQTDQAQLQQSQSDLQAKLAELKTQRPVLLKAIDPDDLEEYEDLRQRKAGRAVAAVKGGVCQGCGIAPSSSQLQQARSSLELVYCGSCGRILYAI